MEEYSKKNRKQKIKPIRIDGDLVYITLTKGKETVIDIADLHIVSGKNYYATDSGNTFYAYRFEKRKGYPTNRALHRILMEPGEGMQVDHIDGNGLNNRRSNLRICTRSENQKNRGASKNNKLGIKGVCYCKHNKGYMASIGVNGKLMNLGVFKTADEAHYAYCEAAKKYHGEFMRTQ